VSLTCRRGVCAQGGPPAAWSRSRSRPSFQPVRNAGDWSTSGWWRAEGPIRARAGHSPHDPCRYHALHRVVSAGFPRCVGNLRHLGLEERRPGARRTLIAADFMVADALRSSVSTATAAHEMAQVRTEDPGRLTDFYDAAIEANIPEATPLAYGWASGPAGRCCRTLFVPLVRTVC
jgi:hypothetical protein